MKSSSNKGHVNNVYSLNALIASVSTLGEAYNPSINLIKLPAMQETSAISGEVVAINTNAFSVWKTAVTTRDLAFKPLSRLVTRAMNFLKATGVEKHVYDQVNTVARKIKGQRASKRNKPEPPVDGTEPEPTPKQISASQMSFDSRISNLAIWTQLLSAIPEYNPNEADLTIESFSILHDDLAVKDNDYYAAEAALDSSRIARNQVLYTPSTGLCDVGRTSKNYVKAVFGASSPQFKQISKIRFITIK